VYGQQLETLRILHQQSEKESRTANIPVPRIVIIEDYDDLMPKDFTLPPQYVKHRVRSEKELDDMTEYELDAEDLDFYAHMPAELKFELTEDTFEKILDRFEKESFKQVCFFLLFRLCVQTKSSIGRRILSRCVMFVGHSEQTNPILVANLAN